MVKKELIMITHILKRDGQLQEFSANKLNGWGEWAAKTLGNHVDWGGVVIEAVNRCPAICPSLQLQKTLIDVCLSRKTWEYNKMAGRLYAALIKRVLYPDAVPTIKQLHSQLADNGMMVVLDYSDEEYKELEKVIDHRMDLKYPHFQLNLLPY